MMKLHVGALSVAIIAGFLVTAMGSASISVAAPPVPSPSPPAAPSAAPSSRPASPPAPAVTPPPPSGNTGRVSQPIQSDAFFNAMRNPAPGGQPPQPPVPLAKTRAQYQARIARTPYTGPQWTSLGASSTGGGQVAGGGNVSGRIYTIVADPTDATGKTLYLGAALGGVWKTTNGGQSWTPLTDSEPSMAIAAIVLDPTNTQTIYAATSDPTADSGVYGSGDFFSAGILVSTNGGAVWSVIGASTFTGQAIFDMDINPDGKTLYVAAGNGFYTGSQPGGVWSFNQVALGGPWTSVRVDPKAPDFVFVGEGVPWVYRPSTGAFTSSTVNPPAGGPGPTLANTVRSTMAVDPTNALNVYTSISCTAGGRSRIPARLSRTAAVAPRPVMSPGGASTSRTTRAQRSPRW